MGWHLIARLDPSEAPALLWKDSAQREWAPLTQILRRDGLDVAALVTAALDKPPAPFLDREATPLANGPIDGVRGSRNVVIYQVVSPDTTVCGLQMWIGDLDEPVTPRPRAAGIIWDCATGTVENSEDTWMLGSPNLEGYGDVHEADQFFTQTVRFDDMLQMIELCTNPEQGGELFTTLTLLHKEGHLATLLVVGRPYNNQVRFITMITTDWVQPTIDPVTAMRISGSTPVGQSSCALLTFTRAAPTAPLVAYWVTEPHSNIAYWAGNAVTERGNEGLIHPEDAPALTAACAQIDSGAPAATVDVRLRRTNGGWERATALVSRYPEESVLARIYVVKFTMDT